MPADSQELLQRLYSASGHLDAVISMVEAKDPCEAILHQLGAVMAALRRASNTLIQCQVEQCAKSLLNDPDPENQAQTLMELSNLYSLLIKTHSHR